MYFCLTTHWLLLLFDWISSPTFLCFGQLMIIIFWLLPAASRRNTFFCTWTVSSSSATCSLPMMSGIHKSSCNAEGFLKIILGALTAERTTWAAAWYVYLICSVGRIRLLNIMWNLKGINIYYKTLKQYNKIQFLQNRLAHKFLFVLLLMRQITDQKYINVLNGG